MQKSWVIKNSFVTNLEPRKIRGLESNGMLFAVGIEKTVFVVPK
ncbi:MAG: hypothetical protein H6791_02655 [Candidatus Nomurabacteria bacterium]|nr:MAG: hypothetical protein H6791_02655 [Candidatus Nomurabacteria bacterium]